MSMPTQGLESPGLSGSTPPPPPRKSPVLKWVLGCCGGILLLMVIAGIAIGIWIGDQWKQIRAKVGPVTATSMAQSVGADIPVYPGATPDTQSSQAALVPLRAAEHFSGRPVGSLFKGIAAYRSSATSEAILDWYDKKLTAAGWKVGTSQSVAGSEQTTYQKGNEMLTIQAKDLPGTKDRSFVLMRGGSELGGRRRSRRNQGGGPDVNIQVR